MTQLFLCYAFNIFSSYNGSNIHDVSTVTDDTSVSDTIVTSHRPSAKRKQRKVVTSEKEAKKVSTNSNEITYRNQLCDHKRPTFHRGAVVSIKRPFNGQVNVNALFLTFLLCLPLLLTPCDAVFSCLSSKCHCVFKSNKLIAECIGFNGIPEVSGKVSYFLSSPVSINSPFTCYFSVSYAQLSSHLREERERGRKRERRERKGWKSDSCKYNLYIYSE